MSTSIDISNLEEKDTSWAVGDFVIIGNSSCYSSTVCRIIYSDISYIFLDISSGISLYDATDIESLKKNVESYYSVVKHYKGSDIKVTLEKIG